MTKSAAIIDFISKLHGVDTLFQADATDQRPGAYDVLTAQSIKGDDAFPDGATLIV